jgi:hypothetical protein
VAVAIGSTVRVTVAPPPHATIVAATMIASALLIQRA